MLSRFLSLCAGFALIAFSTTSSAAESLDDRVAAALADTRTPALGALLIRDGRIAGRAVRGVRRNDGNDPVTAEDPWLIGSTGKPMTAALIAILVERGTLSWDAPLSAMLPELAETMRPEYRSITLVQMLSHRAGLPENLRDPKRIDPYFVDRRPLPEQRLAYVAQALQDAPANAPGSEYVYSNTGFILAATIAERATGEPFETLMQAHVFDPLGMRGAGFGPTGEGQPRGHREGRPSLAMSKSDDGVPMLFTPAGNLHMRLDDWALFCLDQLAGSRGTGKLLTPASYRLMQTAQEGAPGGLDWGVQSGIAGRRGPVLVHGGSDGNWLAWVVLFPESGNGALVIANAAGDMDGERATHALLGALLPELAPAAE
jgi:CubicO group peptidase (beta-lactamase class C family)